MVTTDLLIPQGARLILQRYIYSNPIKFINEQLTNTHMYPVYSVNRYMVGVSEEVDINVDVNQVIDYRPSYDDLISVK